MVARRGFRRSASGYRTLAITAEWDCAGWPADEHAQTAIESYRDGWAWSVPLSADTPPVHGDDRDRSLGARLGQSRRAGCDICARARESGDAERAARGRAAAVRYRGPATRPFTMPRGARQTEGILLVGDAASFIEPLSSAGVKKALLSAWRAAVVANTCLSNQSLAGAAADLYANRERQVYADCTRKARGRSSPRPPMSTTIRSGPSARIPTAARMPATADDEISDDAISRDASVRRAFEQLRAAEHLRLRPSEALRFEQVPSIEGREVVMRDALVLPGLERAVAIHGGREPAGAGAARDRPARSAGAPRRRITRRSVRLPSARF